MLGGAAPPHGDLRRLLQAGSEPTHVRGDFFRGLLTEPVAKVLALHLGRKLCRSPGRKMPDPKKVADKVFGSDDFCNSL